MGHPGRAWDIATAIVYLAGPGARYINGHTLVVDGAEWMYREPLVPREKVVQASRSIEAKSRRTGLAAQSKL